MTGRPGGERDALAQQVADIWRDVLETTEGMDEVTFFELNGDSVAAARIVARIEDELGVLIDIGEIFEEDPDVAALTASVLRQAASPIQG